ncbi:hypothetical protein EDM59_01495 [Brevibacillus nitrificans]|uniref:XkdX family protein n=1 Tax=Brevibacillus nitrificans TaxID=651560 RepID=A0A3M8DPU7_9BACL|nr:hypothetical protein [Brevibacillus nitrificans]RNB90148.1 hypothetical protein EDM59_01495 [Brevibacillus nitrificans]
MAQTFKPYMVSFYSNAVYLNGSRQLPELDPVYQQPVMQFAADNYTESLIDNSLMQGWITQEEYNATMEKRTNV